MPEETEDSPQVLVLPACVVAAQVVGPPGGVRAHVEELTGPDGILIPHKGPTGENTMFTFHKEGCDLEAFMRAWMEEMSKKEAAEPIGQERVTTSEGPPNPWNSWEQFPEPGVPVLAWMSDERYTITHCGSYGWAVHGIRWWMPLPPPPPKEAG